MYPYMGLGDGEASSSEEEPSGWHALVHFVKSVFMNTTDGTEEIDYEALLQNVFVENFSSFYAVT